MDTVVELVAEIFGVDNGTGYRITLGLTLLFVFSFIFFMILRALGIVGGSSKRHSVVLLGVSDVGKTLLFSHLTSGHGVETFTSMKENIVDGVQFRESGGGRKYRLIDLPGADRIRKIHFEQSIKNEDVSAIIYVVDSSTFQKDCRETAEFLYEILSHPQIVKQRRLPILIACNKQDLPLSKSAQVIRKGLEKELSVLNKTRAASLETIDGSGGKRLLTGSHDDDFKFDQLRQTIEFVECSAAGDVRLDDLKDHLKQL